MPEWYPLFKAAEILQCPPWELAGFVYEHAAHMPICWREWALDVFRSEGAMKATAKDGWL